MQRSILEAAVRTFTAGEHIRNVLAGEWVPLHDEHGNRLPGIRGRSGAAAVASSGHEIGVDVVEMLPGAAFALHTHAGDHILYVCPGSAHGIVHVDGVDHDVAPGDTIFIPAELPHGVKTYPNAANPLTFLAFGHPHKHVSATDRMKLVEHSHSHEKSEKNPHHHH